MPSLTEADTCRKYVLPKLYAAGWDDERISEQKTFTDGRIVLTGNKCSRRPQKRADYLLRYRRDFPIAIVEAKAAYKKPGDGLQQAKDYAQILGLQFAYSTNGHGIIEHDFTTGRDNDCADFPSPDDLWKRLRQAESITTATSQLLLTPYYHLSGKSPRYYQEIAINRTVQAILQGKQRVLLTMATGTGKTIVAFQICWKLWNARWNHTGDYRRPRILYLADRNVLVDDPKDKIFAPFGDARLKIEGEANKSREMYFSTYQAIAKDDRRPGLYRDFPPDFFDLIIVDECHRGSARDESNWRDILQYFETAFQLGMTATPLREDNRDTYAYFGKPLYTYSLRQGIDDGFLAPYRVHRIITAAALRSKWSSAEERAAILEALEERGISLEELMAAAKQPDADPFDLLCHVAFNAPLRTRRERAEALRREQKGFFDGYGPKAHEVLNDILEKYIDYGVAQFQIPEILKVPPISERGTVMEIAAMFGGAERLRSAVNEMQSLLYTP